MRMASAVATDQRRAGAKRVLSIAEEGADCRLARRADVASKARATHTSATPCRYTGWTEGMRRHRRVGGSAPGAGEIVSRRTRRTDRQAGSAVLQTMIAAAIVALVVTLAVPAYAARAKESVLRENAKTLEFEVKSYLALDLEATYTSDDDATADAETDPEHSASEVIAQALGGHGGGVSAFYTNPFSGSHAVDCQSDLPTTPSRVPPAVWITDDQRYSYAAFVASPTTKSRLSGTLMLVFVTSGGRASGIEAFYVDAEGARSPTATTLAI